MNIPSLIREVQGALGIRVDGNAGPETWAAIYAKIFSSKHTTQTEPKDFNHAEDLTSARSEKEIATLLPEVQPYARALYHAADAQGIRIEIISGTRTYEEQNALFAQGRSKPGRIVTNAQAGYSNHNFGIAFDIGVFKGGIYVEEGPAYKAVGALGKALGLEWGGDWHSIQDEPHFELHPAWAAGLSERAMLAELRTRHSAGKSIFATA